MVGGGDTCEVKKRKLPRSSTFVVGGGNRCEVGKHESCCWTSVVSGDNRLENWKHFSRVASLVRLDICASGGDLPEMRKHASRRSTFAVGGGDVREMKKNEARCYGTLARFEMRKHELR